MSLLAEVKALWRYRFKTPKHEKEIVFYAEYEGSFPVFEGLIKELVDTHGQTFCYVTSDLHDSILERHDPHIKVFYLKTLLPFFMAFVNCKALVLTLAGIDKHDLKRSMNDVHYIYAFHASHSCNATYEFGALEHYDSMLCVGRHQVDELRKQEELYGFKPKQLIEAGYYRIERIHRGYQAYKAAQPEGAAGKGVVMFAPTWEDNFVLETYAEDIVNSLRNAGYEVIVRLHPETPRRYTQWVDAFEKKHGDDPGFKLERLITTDESFFRADCLITDWSGITPEYAYGTERPVLFLDGVPQKINNDRYEELGIEPMEAMLRRVVGIIVPVDEIADMSKFVDELFARREEFRERILEMRSQYLYNFGHSSEVGARYILDVAAGEPVTD